MLAHLVLDFLGENKDHSTDHSNDAKITTKTMTSSHLDLNFIHIISQNLGSCLNFNCCLPEKVSLPR